MSSAWTPADPSLCLRRRMRAWRRSICVICLTKFLRSVRRCQLLGRRCSSSPYTFKWADKCPKLNNSTYDACAIRVCCAESSNGSDIIVKCVVFVGLQIENLLEVLPIRWFWLWWIQTLRLTTTTCASFLTKLLRIVRRTNVITEIAEGLA